MAIYVVALPKGGATKTTTASELVVALSKRGRSVLAVDLDSQSSLSRRLGFTSGTEPNGTAAQVLLGDASAVDAATASPVLPGVDVLMGAPDMASTTKAPPESVVVLKSHLLQVSGQPGSRWDDVVIDTPPALEIPSLAALAAAQVLIVPVMCMAESFEEVPTLMQVVQRRIKPFLNPELGVDWLIPTVFSRRQVLDRQIVDELARRFPGKVTTPVRKSVDFSNAYLARMPGSLYRPDSPAALDYAAVFDQILGKVPS